MKNEEIIKMVKNTTRDHFQRLLEESLLKQVGGAGTPIRPAQMKGMKIKTSKMLSAILINKSFDKMSPKNSQ